MIPVTVEEKIKRKKCFKIQEGEERQPVWFYEPRIQTLWCEGCEKGRCGICTVGYRGEGYWPDGFVLESGATVGKDGQFVMEL
jgi:hypothetical protein